MAGHARTRTHAMRRPILEKFRADQGDKPLAMLPHKFIVLLLGTMTPSKARNWLDLRAFMQFALSREMIATDPTQGIKLARVKTAGFYTWSETDITAFEAKHLVGSKARLALGLLLHTAQRRGDVIRMGKQHVRDGVPPCASRRPAQRWRSPCIQICRRCSTSSRPTN